MLAAQGFSDNDCAGCTNSRKSTCGFVFLVAGGAIIWSSRTKTCVAISACEADYIAMSMVY